MVVVIFGGVTVLFVIEVVIGLIDKDVDVGGMYDVVTGPSLNVVVVVSTNNDVVTGLSRTLSASRKSLCRLLTNYVTTTVTRQLKK